MLSLISSLPKELIMIIAGYHPLLSKYKRNYIKINIYNSIPQPPLTILLSEFRNLKYKFSNTDISLTIDKKQMNHIILLFFEVNSSY